MTDRTSWFKSQTYSYSTRSAIYYFKEPKKKEKGKNLIGGNQAVKEVKPEI